MTDRPTDVPEFATNTNYATGPDVGTATRVKPSVGELADGFKNGLANAPDAQTMNWAVGLSADWVRYLSGIEIMRYQLNDADTIDTGEEFDLTLAPGYPGVTGFRLSDDGTRLVLADQDDDQIYGFDLKVPGNLRWRTADAGSLNVSGKTTAPKDVALSTDMSKLFLLGEALVAPTDGTLFAYDLSTPGVPSSATYVASLYVGSLATNAVGFSFNQEGTRLYVVGDGRIYRWDMSTPWDLTTAVYASNSLAIGANATSLSVSDDETIFSVGSFTAGIFTYRVTTPGDLESASALWYPSTYLPGGNPCDDAHYIRDGGHLYVRNSDAIKHYRSARVQVSLDSMHVVSAL